MIHITAFEVSILICSLCVSTWLTTETMFGTAQCGLYGCTVYLGGVYSRYANEVDYLSIVFIALAIIVSLIRGIAGFTSYKIISEFIFSIINFAFLMVPGIKYLNAPWDKNDKILFAYCGPITYLILTLAFLNLSSFVYHGSELVKQNYENKPQPKVEVCDNL